MKIAVLGASALLFSVPSYAQQVPAQPAPAAVLQAPQIAVLQPAVQDNILRAGAEIPLITREELTTRKKQLRVGQRVQLEVSANITSNGVTVIPAGTPAVGEITEVRNKGMWGKSGYIGARIISLRMGDRHVRLTGTFDDKGVTGTGGVVAAVAFIPIAGFLTTGTSAYIASGSGVKGFLDEDIAFRTVAATPQVVEVPVTAPIPASTVAPVPAPVTQNQQAPLANTIPASVVK